MNENNSFLSLKEDSLILDIGSGTQDVLLAYANTNPENWTRFILPSPAKIIAQKIQKCTEEKKALILTGSIMGGGFYKAALAHLEKGLSLMATQKAALSLFDDIEKVKSLGIKIIENNELHEENKEASFIELTDFCPFFWNDYLKAIGKTIPKTILIAVQDHGVHKDVGNRMGRFNLWKELLKKSNDPTTWLFDNVPTPYTRLQSIKEYIENMGSSQNMPVDFWKVLLADTGTAALLGVLSMPEVRARSEREGITVINIGNSHVIAFLVYQSKVFGIYEHHTSMHTQETLLKDLEEFRLTWLPDEEVREKGGHGCVFGDISHEAEGFRPTYILGPRREILQGHGQFVAPHGDMMLAGAYGLLYGYYS